jgi:N-hydroxyarylamine O-acetyltransferase
LNIPAYLDRISYSGPVAPTTDVLRQLHRAHMLAVPFENLDIGLGRKIVCDEESILRKIVEQRRGGFCYELNGAFAALLRELGFKVTLLSAGAARRDGSNGPEFDHLTLKIDLEEPWLADVGFGDSFLEPLRLKFDIEQPQGRRKFRLVEEQGSLHMEMAKPEDWKRQYSFTMIPRQLGDFAGMCHYHQTSPESSFTQKKICSRATPDGRITVADRKLIVTRNGRKKESALDSDQEWREALKKYFEIVL